jgi:O-antigen ligase
LSLERARIRASGHAAAGYQCWPTITDFLGKTFLIATLNHWKRLPDLLVAMLCAGVLAAILPGYPLGGQWLGLALLAACAALRRWPHGWLLLVPAALPVLDLAPWTGRFFLDEFDALLAAILLMHAWHARPAAAPAGERMPGAARAWLALFGMSSCLGLLIGAWPFHAPGLNGLNHYYSPYNGFRLAKGMGWAFLLWPLLREALAQDPVKTQRRFALGMGLGVFAAALAVAWERAAFTGLLNFDSGYRVVGLFSGMHTGGAYIEAYFALALPFLAWWTLTSRRWPQRLAGSAMLAVGSYALLVTYARAGYLAAAIGMLVLARAPRLRPRPAPRHALRAALLFALVAVLAWVVANGEAMQRRYASSERDLVARTKHWIDAIAMMDATPASWLVGMGLGSYPRTYFMRSGEGITPSYQALDAENRNTFLALAVGAPLYLEQIISLQPGRRYHLSFLARSRDPDAQLSAPVCEKWMLYSRRCIWQTLWIGDTGGEWQRFSRSFSSRPADAPPHIARPLKLSLFSHANGSLIDIDDVSLRDDDRHELLRNGDFSKGMDFWFFTSDNHLPWHLENTWLQIVFEQGLLGLAGFAGLVLCAIATLLRRLRAGDPYAPVLAAALAAFLALSPLDSVFDFPRLSMIVYLILLQRLHDGKKSMQDGNYR